MNKQPFIEDVEMRLSEHDVWVIKDAIKRRFGQEAEVFLFGSRVDDSRRGGDIHLYVGTSLAAHEANRAKLLAMSDIQLDLGDQKIDMVVSPFVHEGDLVMQEIHREAVPL
jgi:hypothetical protein